MTNLPALSNRAKLALDVLADGGRFVERLERDSYTGRDQFHKRLLRTGAYSSVVKGVGLKAFYELKDGGFLSLTSEGTSVSTYWKLNTVTA
jgi:hypothetical protein